MNDNARIDTEKNNISVNILFGVIIFLCRYIYKKKNVKNINKKKAIK